MLAVWEAIAGTPPPKKRDSLLVVGGLWRANVRGMTALGLSGSGIALASTTLSQLRQRFAELAEAPLPDNEAAHARMSDPERFVPGHVRRLALRHGERAVPPDGIRGVSRYLARLQIRHPPFMLDHPMADANTTVVGFDYWRYADALPATRTGT